MMDCTPFLTPSISFLNSKFRVLWKRCQSASISGEWRLWTALHAISGTFYYFSEPVQGPMETRGEGICVVRIASSFQAQLHRIQISPTSIGKDQALQSWRKKRKGLLNLGPARRRPWVGSMWAPRCPISSTKKVHLTPVKSQLFVSSHSTRKPNFHTPLTLTIWFTSLNSFKGGFGWCGVTPVVLYDNTSAQSKSDFCVNSERSIKLYKKFRLFFQKKIFKCFSGTNVQLKKYQNLI